MLFWFEKQKQIDGISHSFLNHFQPSQPIVIVFPLFFDSERGQPKNKPLRDSTSIKIRCNFIEEKTNTCKLFLTLFYFFHCPILSLQDLNSTSSVLHIPISRPSTYHYCILLHSICYLRTHWIISVESIDFLYNYIILEETCLSLKLLLTPFIRALLLTSYTEYVFPNFIFQIGAPKRNPFWREL